MLARLHHIQTQSFRLAHSRNSSIRATGMADKFNAKQPVDPDVYSARWEAMWAAGIGKGQVGAGPVYGCPSNVHGLSVWIPAFRKGRRMGFGREVELHR